MKQDEPERGLGGVLAARHAHMLLARLGLRARITPAADHPALAWRRSGLMAATGPADGPGLVAPVALTAAADGALAAFRAIAPAADLPPNGAVLLGERSRLLGLRRYGRISANGSRRLLPTQDGLIALNLPRGEDWDLVPAWLCDEVVNWEDLAATVARRETSALVARGRLLGLAIAASPAGPIDAVPFTITRLGRGRAAGGAPLVIDLSALWAGPLAGALLRAAGARVIKVESVARPDGARLGHAGFFDLMNSGKATIALDFADAADIDRLRRVIDAADIVIESTRPRALAQLGIDAAMAARRGATWISITAHGRAEAAGNWIGYGDDAAVAGGLSVAMVRGWGEASFAGDAIADPLTGITAALAGWTSWRQGGGRLIAFSLAGIVADACRLHETDDVRRWQAIAEADAAPLYALRTTSEPAGTLGADTAAVLATFADESPLDRPS